jgi:hypothetical protein
MVVKMSMLWIVTPRGHTNVSEEYIAPIFRADSVPRKSWCLLTSPHGVTTQKVIVEKIVVLINVIKYWWQNVLQLSGWSCNAPKTYRGMTSIQLHSPESSLRGYSRSEDEDIP